MKICLVGHFNNDLDEGVRNVGKSIDKQLKKIGMNTITVDITSIFDWKKIKDFNPNIIHFVLTPTLNGLIVAKTISIINPKSKIIISAIHPSIPKWRILKLLKPDLILVQASDSEKIFKSLGYRTKVLYNWVDVDKFKNVDQVTKIRLRKKYKLPIDKFIILHLASLKRERNLDIFKKLQKDEDNQVVIIGRENEDFDKKLKVELEESGCIVWIKHFERIEEIYNLSDCYIFPTKNKKACIETPLSVLEAMACNLPVVTTKYGALTRMFQEGNGMFFLSNNIDNSIKQLKSNNNEIKTREKVLKYSNHQITSKLRETYDFIQ